MDGGIYIPHEMRRIVIMNGRKIIRKFLAKDKKNHRALCEVCEDVIVVTAGPKICHTCMRGEIREGNSELSS